MEVAVDSAAVVEDRESVRAKGRHIGVVEGSVAGLLGVEERSSLAEEGSHLVGAVSSLVGEDIDAGAGLGCIAGGEDSYYVLLAAGCSLAVEDNLRLVLLRSNRCLTC
jgi:hypothetical protein